jgi:uncharacterized membrane protein YbaN (DUF454 family)
MISTRTFWLCIGLTATGLGLIGVVLPLMPTTVFLILAAYAFARSSPRLHGWLTEHRRFGPLILNWQRHGSIDRRAKLTAVAVMAATFAVSWIVGVSDFVLGAQAVVLGAVAAFILTRPGGPGNDNR